MPLTDEDLRNLLADTESDRVERTVSTSDTAKFAQAICAFCNDLPNSKKTGYLIVGANDDGTLARVKIDDALLRVFGDLRQNGKILPPPMLVVDRRSLDGFDLVVVEVQPSQLTPIRYEGRVWIRVGPRKAVATAEEERRLTEKRAHTLGKTFDTQPCLASSIDDLALALFTNEYLPQAVAEEVLRENGRSIQEQLASLRLYDLTSDKPTNAAVLLFGSNPQYFFEGDRIQFLRFNGESMTDAIANDKSISGALVTVIRDVETLLELNINAAPVFVSPMREEMRADYPRVALRELVVNAIIHRNYESTSPLRVNWFSDRIEIQSPGGLYGEATPENFPKINAYRNPVLAEAFMKLGYANRYGYGVQRAQAELQRHGNPPAKFEFDSNYVLVSIPKRSTT